MAYCVVVMNGQPTRRYRKHIRMTSYDYSAPGYYFVTLVTLGRRLLFDDVHFREIVDSSWRWLAQRYQHVDLDYFVVMPNHLHGIIALTDDAAGSGGSRAAPTRRNKPLGQLIGAFKTVSAKEINRIRCAPGAAVWQLNYYERVIRNERELDAVRQYIVDNPAKWALDPQNPERLDADPRPKGGSRAAATSTAGSGAGTLR